MDETISSTTSQTDAKAGPASTPPSHSTQLAPAQLLWSEFLKTMSTKPRKYPNPDVPEFCPRNRQIGYTDVTRDSSEDGQASSSTTIETSEHELLVTRMPSLHFTADVPDHSPSIVNTHYYWTFDQPSLSAFVTPTERIPPALNSSPNAAKTVELPLVAYARTPLSVEQLRAELNTKNQQLAHMNNVVRALLEEIWKINELSTRSRSRELGTGIGVTIERYLKSAAELGLHCEDCCGRMKEFVIHVSRQLERRVARQHLHYKNDFVDGVVSVIENSLRLLTPTRVDVGATLRKQDACTQTVSSLLGYEQPNAGGCSRQPTRVYRNRNLYKRRDDSNWFGAPEPTRLWRYGPQPRVRWSTRPPATFDGLNRRNPIQLIHQRYKNLNCRLEGMPNENLVKFSYIVNGKEYSAIANTKRQAQYLCAWHVLNSSTEE